MKNRIAWWIALMWLFPSPLRAQATAVPIDAQEETTHNELRALRDRLVKAVDTVDIEQMLSCLHKNVVITWQNGEVGRGHEGARRFYARMMTGPNPVVQSYKTEVTVDELTILYGGDAGIAFGTAIDRFKLTSGMQLDLNDRWTATVVKENGTWSIASLHVSSSVFDNPLLRIARNTAYWAGGICLVVGGILGFIVGRRLRKSRS